MPVQARIGSGAAPVHDRQRHVGLPASLIPARHSAAATASRVYAVPRSVQTASTNVMPPVPSVRAEEASEPQPLAPVPFAISSPAKKRGSRWTASAYAFVRPGSGASLAGGGALGGSQAAARVTYRLNGDTTVRTALAARVYAPLRGRGAEGAVGLDWHPLPTIPFRLSVERRVGLDRAGRDAWSAYAAGGFYAEPRPGAVVDGYAQAGVVGARSRDLFADAAVRVGRRMNLGKAALVVGGGAWGAAQPGAERLDVGPRVATAVPVMGGTLAVAAEARLRVAGQARPGSSAALTVSVDF
jgi:hypothetical protein